MSNAEILLIRHAESSLNARGCWQGLNDSPLSASGLCQAAALAERLAGERIAALFASDLSRAHETARIVGRPHGLEPHPEPALRELDVGAWGGLTREEIGSRWPEALARFDSGDPDARPVGGESRREMRERVRRAVARIAASHAGRCVAIVTHLGPIGELLAGASPGNAEWRRVQARALGLGR